MNIVVDAVIGIVPIIGDALDVAFKANVRNLRLLEGHLARTPRVARAWSVQLAPPYEEEFAARRPTPPGAGARPGAGQGAGMDWATVGRLLNAFSIGSR